MSFRIFCVIASAIFLPLCLTAQAVAPPGLPDPLSIVPPGAAIPLPNFPSAPFTDTKIDLGSEAHAHILSAGHSQVIFIGRADDMVYMPTTLLDASNPDVTEGCFQSDPGDRLRPKTPISKQEPRWKNYPRCGEKDWARPFVRARYQQLAAFPTDWPDLSRVDLNANALPGLGRFLLLEAGETCPQRPGDKEPAPPYNTPNNRLQLCYYRTLLVNTGSASSAHWVEGLRATSDGLKINRALFHGPEHLTFVINSTPLREEMSDLIFGSRDISNYHVEVYEETQGCRKYALQYDEENPPESIDVEIPILQLREFTDNGIYVGAPKVYDSFLLRSKLNAAAQQLAAISPWSATAITNAYGSLQGVTRDVSYVAAQITTAATPSQATTTTNGSTTLSPTVSETAQCPGGYVASAISATGVTCTQLPTQAQASQCPTGYYVSQVSPASSGQAATVVCSQLPVTNPSSPPSTSLTQNNTAPQSTQVVTTNPSLTPTVPTAPAASPLSAPTNISVSAADMLAEQVQLNAQLQMYQMLLQGSQSDQFLLKNSRAVAARAQTTIGFQISVAPPRQFKHAVAEVRVVVVPHPTPDRHFVPGAGNVSVVNLLPSQKTYNVAKITSNQKAFGAGAVIEQVNVGFTTGKSKDRLYLAKDTDTIALEYPKLTVPVLDPPFPERVLEGIEETVKEQRLHECEATWEGDRPSLESSSIMFGWQFRPVLGADYVSAGPREVFAQLALPTSLDEDGFAPAVYVQTRWREYDEKRQVVGPVFHSSCNWTRVQESVSILNPLRVHNVTWDDVGNGTLKVKAKGEFFASGMSVMSGGTNIPPAAFDGKTIQFFAPAHDLLQNGDIQLLGENGRTTLLAIATKKLKVCGISDFSLRAVPYPDGNSRVELKLDYAPDYKPSDKDGKPLDGQIHPLLLIGADVYGLQQKPYLDKSPCDNGQDYVTCTYHFVAPTDSLRSAQTFLVRDPAWHFSNRSTIDFAPAFTGITALSPPPSKDSSAPAEAPLPPARRRGSAAPAPAAVSYAVSGSGFHAFSDKCKPGSQLGLVVYVDDNDGTALTCSDFTVLSDTNARLHLSSTPKGKNLKLIWDPKNANYNVMDGLPIAWDLAIPQSDKDPKVTASPAFLYAGDSRIVTFAGTFANIVDVEFEGTVLLKPDSPNPKTLDVPIPLSITKTPGHKELVAKTIDSKGKPGKIVLPLDVFIPILER